MTGADTERKFSKDAREFRFSQTGQLGSLGKGNRQKHTAVGDRVAFSE